MAPPKGAAAPKRRPHFADSTNQQPADEHDPLLAHYVRYSDQEAGRLRQRRRSQGKIPPWVRRTGSYLNQDIDTTRGDLVLIFCFFINGLVDSGAYNAFSCFVGMVTGNTIFLALGLSDLPVTTSDWAWTKSLCSILSFWIGTVCFSTLHGQSGDRRRWALIVDFVAQGAVTIAAALLVGHRVVSETPTKGSDAALFLLGGGLPADPGFPWADLIPIGLLSFQASGKVLSSRLLEAPHLVTAVLTLTYTDLLADQRLLTAGLFSNVKRNQRVGAMLFYFTGACLGGVFARSPLGFQGALWLTSGCNLFIAALWAVWRAQPPKEAEQQADDDDDDDDSGN